MPQLKTICNTSPLSHAAKALVCRFVIAFVLHVGRMSCLAAAQAIRSDARHRAQLTRFLARERWKEADLNAPLRRELLEMEKHDGLFVFVLDATMVSQSGKHTQNTYSTGNRTRRPQQGRRYGKTKHTRKQCHSFTLGLLITPSGIRLPYAKPYYTKDYAKRHGVPYHTTAEAAAELIRQLPLHTSEGYQVVVLGDTAYDAKEVHKACHERNDSWIMPCNPERVFAGPKGARPKLRSSLQNWSSRTLQTLTVSPGQGNYVAYRRLSRYRLGRKAKPQVYYACVETRPVHSVGEVQIVFSTKKQHLVTATADDVKILMTNDLTLPLRDIVELYSLRWQMELFFKEMKSTLGFDQYQFEEFACVEGWLELALTSFLYLERYRAQQLARDDLCEQQKAWWRVQRTHGVCCAVRLASEWEELAYLAEHLHTPEGIVRVQEMLRHSSPPEYQPAL